MTFDELNPENFKKSLVDLGILLEEEIIPYMLQRNYWEELKQFGTWEAWECMEDQITRMNNVIRLYEYLSKCEIVEPSNETEEEET